ncbi:MAG: hypothetical protein JWQ11_3092, partial [Rhizobacter sp.]|nr:hypothetical protein [Rhizobacter sp.]
RLSSLFRRFGEVEVREYIAEKHVLMYCLVGNPISAFDNEFNEITVYLLAIKHHRQLSFDFQGFWEATYGGEL